MKLDLRRPEAKATVMTILTLAWPTIIEQVMQTAVQYIDTAMVGALGYYEYLAGHTAGPDLNAYATMSLTTEKERYYK